MSAFNMQPGSCPADYDRWMGYDLPDEDSLFPDEPMRDEDVRFLRYADRAEHASARLRSGIALLSREETVCPF